MTSGSGAHREPVVVTGAHRSGTTLLGDILCHADGTWNVWEPFNRHWGLEPVRVAYPYLTADDAEDERLLALKTYLTSGRGRWSVKEGPAGPSHPRTHAAVKTLKRRALWLRNRSAVPVVKDPFVLLSLNALQAGLTSRTVVVSVRHPCSWILSLRRMSWPAGPELNDLISQSALYEEHLADRLPARDWTKADDLTAGAVAWMCLYGMVLDQVRMGAKVLMVPLEGFAQDPVSVMWVIFDAVGLASPSDIEDLAVRYTQSDRTVTPDSSTKHLLQRDSKGLSEAWKSKLAAAEIARVRELTEPVFGALYSDWDAPDGAPRLLAP
ncbi:MAG: hypothetical protein LH645_05230 [Actinomycetia bacterium]|nr:hypothetical protein [Actinomycetes bacterium]